MKQSANLDQTCLVHVQQQLHSSFHLHDVLEEAAAERGLSVWIKKIWPAFFTFWPQTCTFWPAENFLARPPLFLARPPPLFGQTPPSFWPDPLSFWPDPPSFWPGPLSFSPHPPFFLVCSLISLPGCLEKRSYRHDCEEQARPLRCQAASRGSSLLGREAVTEGKSE